jgi:hypothetical protein
MHCAGIATISLAFLSGCLCSFASEPGGQLVKLISHGMYRDYECCIEHVVLLLFGFVENKEWNEPLLRRAKRHVCAKHQQLDRIDTEWEMHGLVVQHESSGLSKSHSTTPPTV